MSKTLIGIVTFGNLPFTKLAVRGVQETVLKYQYEFFIVIGKPNDVETLKWVNEEKLPYRLHSDNKGFPASINDIYDYAWVDNSFDYIVTMGNDVIPYPFAIDSLISTAEMGEFSWLCAREYNVQKLVKDYPSTKKYFDGADLIFKDFSSRPWEMFHNYSETVEFDAGGLSDVHNLALYSRKVFEDVGYIDVNFYPAYFEDNDYAFRGKVQGIKSATIRNAMYFHFWSRTIKQGSGGSTSKFFNLNKEFYVTKWGGEFAKEKWRVPFNGNAHRLTDSIILTPELIISNRRQELEIINYWKHHK